MSKRHIIAFDTETSGLLKPEENDMDQQPHIFEFAALKFDEDGKELDSMCVYINPGIDVPAVITKITGIKRDTLAGKPSFVGYYKQIADFFVGVHILTAHNLAFDREMLANELIRIDQILKFPWPPIQICTVREAKKVYGYRLNLTNLHKELFGTDFKDAHTAMADVLAQKKCFLEMVNRGIIKL